MSIEKYYVFNNGTICHEDDAEGYVVENDDSTWVNTTYKVEVDLLPYELLDDVSLVEDIILNYHYGNIDKPSWLIV